MRFERAYTLLREPGVSMLGVALSLGFSEPANFGRAFRGVMGMTSGETPRIAWCSTLQCRD